MVNPNPYLNEPGDALAFGQGMNRPDGDHEPSKEGKSVKTIQEDLTPAFWGGGSPQANSFVKKILLLGEPAVGKTSLVRRFVYDIFDDMYISSIGVKIVKKTMILSAEKDLSTSQDVEVNFLLWDIEGQKGREELSKSYCAGAEGALVVCDLTRKDTLDALPGWISDLQKLEGSIPILIFLVNKNDLKEDARFGEDDVKALASKYHASYFFTSAKTGYNVENAFRNMGRRLFEGKK